MWSRCSSFLGAALSGVVGASEPVCAGVLAEPRRQECGSSAGVARETGCGLADEAAAAERAGHRRRRLMSTTASQPERGGERERLGDGVDETGRHAGIRRAPAPSALRMPPADAVDDHAQLRAVRDAARVVGEAGIIGQLGRAEQPQQRAELPVVADGDHELTVGRPKQLVGRDARVRVAEARRGRRPVARVPAAWLVSAESSVRQQVDLDRAARRRAGRRAAAQREQDPGERVLPGEHVDEGDADLARLAVGWPVTLISPPTACTSRS